MNSFLHADNGQFRVKWETFGEASIPHYQVASWLLRLTVISVGCIAVDAPNCTSIYNYV